MSSAQTQIQAGADFLHSIFGTEKDRVNCPFFFKIGACRHGENCERRHNRPTLSQTILMPNMYMDPRMKDPELDEKGVQDDFEFFYEDIFVELERFGEIEEMNVCENVCEHLAGNVYVKWRREEDAGRAMKNLSGRFYSGQAVHAEFSPVTDFRESSCRQFENNECTRGGLCNFMHLKTISRDLYRELFRYSVSRHRKRSRSRSRSRERKRHRSRSREKDKKEKKEKERDRDKERDREKEKERKEKDREREKGREEPQEQHQQHQQYQQQNGQDDRMMVDN